MAEQRDILPAGQQLPQKLYVVPFTGKPVFPGIFTPIMITDDKDLEVVNSALEHDSMVGFVLTRDAETDQEVRGEDLFEMGTVAKIVDRKSVV